MDAYIETTDETELHLQTLLDREKGLSIQLEQVTERLILLQAKINKAESKLLKLHIDPADVHEDMVMDILQRNSTTLASPQQESQQESTISTGSDYYFQLQVRYQAIKAEMYPHQAGVEDQSTSRATPLEQ